jgi:hypothetical protein
MRIIEWLSENWWAGVAAIVAIISLLVSIVWKNKSSSGNINTTSSISGANMDSVIAGPVFGDATIDKSTKVLPDNRPANLQIVSLELDYKESFNMDIKLRNDSPQVVFATEILINIYDFVKLVDRTAAAYPANITAEYSGCLPVKKCVYKIKISQCIKANDVDRILVKLTADDNMISGIIVYLFDFVIVYNEDKRKVASRKMLAHIPCAKQPLAYTTGMKCSPQDKRKMAKEAKQGMNLLEAHKHLECWPSYEEVYSSFKSFYDALK